MEIGKMRKISKEMMKRIVTNPLAPHNKKGGKYE